MKMAKWSKASPTTAHNEIKETAMAIKPTHFKYLCRICQKEHLQPVLLDAPEKTPIPRCCGRDRDMAYKGVYHEHQA